MINQSEKSLLPVAFPSKTTMQQAPNNCATGYATSTQQPPVKPASLLDIARNKLRNKHATGSENSVQQAPQNTSEVVAQKITSWRWLLRYPDRDVEVCTMPESTRVEMLRDFPGAIAAEPIPDRPKQRATPAQEAELRVLVTAIYSGGTDADRAEALAAALADPEDALVCYRAIQDELKTRPEHLQSSGNTNASPDPHDGRATHPARRAA